MLPCWTGWAAVRRSSPHLVMAGRSHNVPAQATTLGKRFASAAQEILQAYQRLSDLLARYPMRGIKGPMGTSQDMLDLLGSPEAVATLESSVVREVSATDNLLDSVGQVYPRSLDYEVVSALVQLAAGPASLATTIRLMAGAELATEGFQPGQVGSSAMPHKMNARSCERVCGLAVVLRGYASMAGELAGAQWNEGDVFCSVVRRVALPDAFYAIDGLFETFLTVLDDFGAYPAVIDRELERYLPFLATTKVLIAAVRAGVGRETAHEVISEHAVAVALAMREKGQVENDLIDRLAADERLPLRRADLETLLADRLSFTGLAAAAGRGGARPDRRGHRGTSRCRRLPARGDPVRRCATAAGSSTLICTSSTHGSRWYPTHGFVPEPFTCQDYLTAVRPLGVGGGVVVSGSFQAFDQTYLLDALAALGPSFVGVTALPADCSEDEIVALDRAGVRAVRFNLRRGGSAGLAGHRCRGPQSLRRRRVAQRVLRAQRATWRACIRCLPGSRRSASIIWG